VCTVCGAAITPPERAEAGFAYCKDTICGRWARQPLELVEVKSGKTGTMIVQRAHVQADAAAGRTRDARRL